jgi:hypothetical protein
MHERVRGMLFLNTTSFLVSQRDKHSVVTPTKIEVFSVHLYHQLKRTRMNRKVPICNDMTVEINSVPPVFCGMVVFICGMCSI